MSESTNQPPKRATARDNASMGFWWDELSDENLFMEISRRNDPGVDLKAPVAARGGVETPGYALVGAVKAGDVVIHYDSTAEKIVGISRATGEKSNQPIWWAARGTYARKAAVQPKWLPGISVALEGYQPLRVPLGLDVIRTRRDELFALRDKLQATHPRQPLYFPWIPYQESLRTFQTYLAKFPRDALTALPELLAPIDRVTRSDIPSATQPEITRAEREVAKAAGRPAKERQKAGQGFASDQAAKVTVEAHAMNAALAHYQALGDVVDTSRTESYDYVIDIGGETWHVEVKGTTGDPTQVLLTPNEVTHAEQYPHTALFILSNITVVRGPDGTLTASGGRATVFHPWSLDADRLTPIGFKYRVHP